MTMHNVGPPISSSDVLVVEAIVGVEFPDPYRRFLLRTNGGSPTPDTIDVPGLAGSPTDVQVFFGVGRPIISDNLVWNFDLLRERCTRFRALPIACDSGGNLFCLNLERERAVPSVFYCDLDSPDCTDFHVAASFEEFVERLRRFDEN